MRSEKEVQAELDKARGEYKAANDRGDMKKVEELGNRIKELETEFNWIML